MLGKHRLSTIFMFTGDNETLNDMLVTFLPNKGPKLSRKGRPKGKFQYKSGKNKSCAITCLKEYILLWNVAAELEYLQLIITTKESYRRSSIKPLTTNVPII